MDFTKAYRLLQLGYKVHLGWQTESKPDLVNGTYSFAHETVNHCQGSIWDKHFLQGMLADPKRIKWYPAQEG